MITLEEINVAREREEAARATGTDWDKIEHCLTALFRVGVKPGVDRTFVEHLHWLHCEQEPRKPFEQMEEWAVERLGRLARQYLPEF